MGLPDACRGERGGRQSVGAGQPPTLWLQCGERDHRDGMSCIDDRAGTPAALAGVAIDDDGLEQVPGAEGAPERFICSSIGSCDSGRKTLPGARKSADPYSVRVAVNARVSSTSARRLLL